MVKVSVVYNKQEKSHDITITQDDGKVTGYFVRDKMMNEPTLMFEKIAMIMERLANGKS